MRAATIQYITTVGIGQPWVGNELLAARRAGIAFDLHALRPPGQDYFRSPEVQALAGDTRVLYPLPVGRTLGSLALAPFLFGGRFLAALGNALFGSRESLRARIRTLAHLAVACDWARSLNAEPPALIHSQWAHSSASVGMYGAWLLGVPFSFTGHAVDLFRDRAALHDKVRRADFIICISKFHREFFLEQGARPEQLRIAYCGIDLDLFQPRPDGTTRLPGSALRIRSSGRLVEKKGFRYLIDACARLAERGIAFECVIGGDGPLQTELEARIEAAGLGDRVRLTGEALHQEDIPAFMRSGDVYALPCVWASDGDVDGLPQMLMEAMACGLPVISTRLVGIPDLIIDSETGLLVPPNDAEALADALARMESDAELSRELTRNGRAHVAAGFDIANSLEPLFAEFRARLDR